MMHRSTIVLARSSAHPVFRRMAIMLFLRTFATATKPSELSCMRRKQERSVLLRCLHQLRSKLPASPRSGRRVPACQVNRSVLHSPLLTELLYPCLFHHRAHAAGTVDCHT